MIRHIVSPDDLAYPHVTYRCGAAGIPTPVLRGTGIRVQTLVVAAQQWGWTPAQIAAEYDLSEVQVNGALAFYEAHRTEIDAAADAEQEIEKNGSEKYGRVIALRGAAQSRRNGCFLIEHQVDDR